MDANFAKMNNDFSTSINKDDSIKEDIPAEENDAISKSNLDKMLEQYEHRDTQDDDTFFEKGRNS